MKCRKCGTEIADDSIRCSNCGIKVNMVCPKCKTLVPFGTLVCTSCGFELLKKCHSCGAVNSYSSIRCRKCNADLPSEPLDNSPSNEGNEIVDAFFSEIAGTQNNYNDNNIDNIGNEIVETTNDNQAETAENEKIESVQVEIEKSPEKNIQNPENIDILENEDIFRVLNIFLRR